MTRRYASDAQVRRAAMLARELQVELVLAPDGAIHVKPQAEGGDEWERMARAARG